MIDAITKELANSGPLGILCSLLLIAVVLLVRELQKERQARIDDAKRLNDAGAKLLDAAANRAAARISHTGDDQ